MELVDILSNMGIDTRNIQVTSNKDEFTRWVEDYLSKWYNEYDEILYKMITESAFDGGLFILPFPDGDVKVYIKGNDDYLVYSAVGSIIQAKLGVRISGAFGIVTENCNSEEVESFKIVSLVTNSTLVNLIGDVLSHAIVAKIAPSRYSKVITKSMEKLRRNFEVAIKKGVIPEPYGKWGVWIIDSVFFNKDEKVVEMVNNTSIHRDRDTLLELLRYVVKKSKEFGFNARLEEEEKNGVKLYVIKASAKVDCRKLS